MDKMSLGEFYRELRVARKVKQKDVAKGRLTASQLSKFEQGQSMLSADRLFQAIEGINMTFSEFGHALNNYQSSPFVRLGRQISELQLAGDVEGLLALRDGLKGSSLYEQLMGIIVKSALFSVDLSYPMEKRDLELLVAYLYEVESWTTFELYLFGNTTDVLPVLDLVYLGKFALERTQLYQSLTANKEALKLTLINLIASLIEKKETQTLPFFVSRLRKLLKYNDIFYSVLLTFFEQVDDYFNHSKGSLEELEQYLKYLEILGSPPLISLLRLRLERCCLIYSQ